MAEYETTSYNGRTIFKHRLVWIQKHGAIPEGCMIHHINGNKNDNLIENLECVDRKLHGKKHLLPNRTRIVYPNGAVKVIKNEQRTSMEL